MEASKELINGAAAILRRQIDDLHDRLFDDHGMAVANSETKDLYDAVTLLHEQAMKGLS